jgi:hypothetical protein
MSKGRAWNEIAIKTKIIFVIHVLFFMFSANAFFDGGGQYGDVPKHDFA